MIRRRSRVEVDSASRRVLPPRRALGTGFFPLVLSLCPGEISTLRARVAGPAFAAGIEAALTTAR